MGKKANMKFGLSAELCAMVWELVVSECKPGN